MLVAEILLDPRAVKIANAAKELNELRNEWLNPQNLIDVVDEVTPTGDKDEKVAPPEYPKRIVVKGPAEANELRRRTLTNLYNEKPQWLVNAHSKLDRAVAEAYGWPKDIGDDDALERLLHLNLAQSRSAELPTKEDRRV